MNTNRYFFLSDFRKISLFLNLLFGLHIIFHRALKYSKGNFNLHIHTLFEWLYIIHSRYSFEWRWYYLELRGIKMFILNRFLMKSRVRVVFSCHHLREKHQIVSWNNSTFYLQNISARLYYENISFFHFFSIDFITKSINGDEYWRSGEKKEEWEKQKLQLTSEIERKLFLFLFFIKMSVKGK